MQNFFLGFKVVKGIGWQMQPMQMTQMAGRIKKCPSAASACCMVLFVFWIVSGASKLSAKRRRDEIHQATQLIVSAGMFGDVKRLGWIRRDTLSVPCVFWS